MSEHEMRIENTLTKVFTEGQVAEMLRSLMYKNAKSMPSRTLNKKIRTLAEKEGIEL